MNCPVCKTEAPPVVGKPFHSLTDVHGHYVFGVDDGPSSLEMSMKMIRSAWQQGVWAIVCTSHSWDLEKYECHFAQLKLCLQKERLDVRLYPGAEIACSEDAVSGLLERLKSGALHTNPTTTVTNSDGREVRIYKSVEKVINAMNREVYSIEYLVAVAVNENIVLGFRIDASHATDSEIVFEDSVIDILLSHCVFGWQS